MAISGLKIVGLIGGTSTTSPGDGSIPTDAFTGQFNLIPSDATELYHEQITVTAGSNVSLDLSGALTDVLNQAATFAKVYAILVINLNTVAGDFVWVGNSNFATWIGASTDKVKVGPKGCMLLASVLDGYAVTNSTGDTLTIAAPGANNVTVKVIVLGK